MFDVGKLIFVYIMVIFVVVGVILDGFNLYELLIDFVGVGVIVFIISFGNVFVYGVMEEVVKYGIVGVIIGMFKVMSVGVLVVIIFGFIGVLLFKLKG